MPTYDDYIINSDFATLSELGDRVSGSVTLPGSTVIAAGATWTATNDIALSGSGSFRSHISSSKIAGVVYPGSWFTISRAWSGFNLPVEVLVFRLNSSTVRIQASAFNPYSTSVTSPAGNEVFTVNASNMVLPF